MEKTHKDIALRLAAERGISVSRLFVNWLLQDLDGQRALQAQRDTPESNL